MKAQAAAAPAHKSVQVKRSKDDQIFFLVSHIIVILLTLIVLYPLIYIISSSFSSANAVSTGQVVLLPVEPSVMGYQKVFENAKVWTGYKNTLIYTVLGGPLGDLDRYENPQTMVINWAQDAFGGKEQIVLLMQQVGRPCALADADQQDAANALAEAGEAPAGVSLQDGYLLVNFTGWTAE